MRRRLNHRHGCGGAKAVHGTQGRDSAGTPLAAGKPRGRSRTLQETGESSRRRAYQLCVSGSRRCSATAGRGASARLCGAGALFRMGSVLRRYRSAAVDGLFTRFNQRCPGEAQSGSRCYCAEPDGPGTHAGAAAIGRALLRLRWRTRLRYPLSCRRRGRGQPGQRCTTGRDGPLLLGTPQHRPPARAEPRLRSETAPKWELSSGSTEPTGHKWPADT
jgi:hypothetical protein